LVNGELCPCGSTINFEQCCYYPKEGNTPEDVKKRITRIVISTFDKAGDTRGETCLYVASLVKDLLNEFGIKSYIAAGSSKWNRVATFYDWKPPREFHSWAVTEFGETVDLACDALNERSDWHYHLSNNVPTRCWKKELKDRDYKIYDYGAKTFEFDEEGYRKLLSIALNKLKR
jgi:hypothetical protein